MSQKPTFDTIGDEPLEARIVAWVLGDASAFEATELERLCEERPELLVFRRRMRALHSLLSEAEAAVPEDATKLPPDKRKLLDEIFGVESSAVSLESPREAHIHKGWRRRVLAIAACLILLVVLGGLTAPQMLRMRKQASAAAQARQTSSFQGSGASEVVIREMRKAIREQEDKVEERRKVLANIGRAKGLIYREAGMENDSADRSAIDTFNQLETEKLQSESMIQSLLKYDGERLMTYASGLQLPDNAVKTLYPKYLEQKSKLELMQKQGAREQDPTLRAQQQATESMKKQLDEGVVLLRDTLQAKMELAEARLKRALTAKNEKRGEAIKRGLDVQDYVDAKRDLEAEQQLLQQMKLKLIGDEIASKMPDESLAFNKSASVRPASAAGAKALSESRSKPLTSELPPERLEGTPQAIKLPDLAQATKEVSSEANLAFSYDAKPSDEPAKLKRALELAANSERGLAERARVVDSIPQQAEHFESKPPAGTGTSGGLGTAHGFAPGSDSAAVARNEADAYAPAALEPAPAEPAAPQAPVASTAPGGDDSVRKSGQGDAIKRGLDAQDFDDAKRDYEAEFGKLQQTKQRLADAELAKRETRDDADFNGVTHHGAPIHSPQDEQAGIATAGNRSGDGFLNRNSIDAILTDQKNRGSAGAKDAQVPPPSLKPRIVAGDVDGEDSRLAKRQKPDETGAKSRESVRRGLYTAEGNYNLGKYDAAKVEYEKVLRSDPNNQAARKGLETIASAKSKSYRAAYDQTRAELTTDVDKAWELQTADSSKSAESKASAAIIRDFDKRSKVATPAKPAAAGPVAAAEPTATPPPAARPGSLALEGQDAEVARPKSEPRPGEIPAKSSGAGDPTGNADPFAPKYDSLTNQPAEGEKSVRLSDLVQREAFRRLSVVADSDRLLTDARDAYGNSDYQQAYTCYEKALAMLPDAPATQDRRAALRQHLAEAAVTLAGQAAKDGRNDESRTWLGKAVEWDPANQQARQLLVVDATSECTAVAVPYSTFSLSISEVSFKMTQAALARGERPDPAAIKVEQFYNAVDYGDPAPGSSEPVAGWVEQAAHPVIPGRNLVRVAIRTGAAGRSAAQALRLTLLVDQSGSMAREDRRAAMENALKQLGGLLTKNDLVTLIGFSRSPRLLADALSGDQGERFNEVVNQAASEGGTNLEEAMKLGEQMALRHLTAGAQNRIVLFTDGAANLGNADPSRLADKVKAMRQKGLAFDIAGIGTSNLNDQLLGELARHGNGRYYVVSAAKDAEGGFARQLAGAFRPAAENVKVQVRFNPQRVGRYKLLGFEEHRLNTEDFRNDVVDAAELAAEEAGVALYQVEPLAEGSGEIGEASVRFRDVASGQMVERTWTIPYEASAPAFDRAAPSMQLAGLALLAAEKLRGGPLAEAIDFKQLVAPRATVKQYYSNSRRVAEMLEVVNRL
jgi:tetratricopeptide (TPR) repeat protein